MADRIADDYAGIGQRLKEIEAEKVAWLNASPLVVEEQPAAIEPWPATGVFAQIWGQNKI